MASRLAPRRRPTRWLVVLASFAVLFVATVGVFPHGDEDQRCLACKARHQPLQELVALLAQEAPPSTASRAPIDDTWLLRTTVTDSSSPRAPPA